MGLLSILGGGSGGGGSSPSFGGGSPSFGGGAPSGGFEMPGAGFDFKPPVQQPIAPKINTNFGGPESFGLPKGGQMPDPISGAPNALKISAMMNVKPHDPYSAIQNNPQLADIMDNQHPELFSKFTEKNGPAAKFISSGHFGGNTASTTPNHRFGGPLPTPQNETTQIGENSLQDISPNKISYKNEMMNNKGGVVGQGKFGETQQTLPQANMQSLAPVMTQYGITTPQRQAAFLAQIQAESSGGKHMEELGSRSYFNKYDGRMGNGPGEGYTYRGRGYIQLTGKDNYQKYSDKLGIDLVNNPDWAARPETASRIAAQYWTDHNFNDLADKGDINGITRGINGRGAIAKTIEQRGALYNTYLKSGTNIT